VDTGIGTLARDVAMTAASYYKGDNVQALERQCDEMRLRELTVGEERFGAEERAAMQRRHLEEGSVRPAKHAGLCDRYLLFQLFNNETALFSIHILYTRAFLIPTLTGLLPCMEM
jgi:hypothetical protein